MLAEKQEVNAPVDNRFDSAPAPGANAELTRIREAIEQTGARWTAGETAVARLAPEVRAGLLSPTPFGPVLPPQPLPRPLPSLPAVYDWTNADGANYVTPVKMQFGGAGAAFASAAALESCVLRARLMHGDTLDLAEHAVAACPDGGSGNLHAIAAFLQATGLPPEDWFPGDLATARPGWQFETYRVGRWDCFYPTEVAEVKALVAQYGPVVTTMTCPEHFLSYTGGIYSNIGDPGEAFHAVLIVGYDDRDQCFRVKNSWGKDWGENRRGVHTAADNGYFRIAYSEFRSPVVNFGWDIHTYAAPLGPNAVAVKTLTLGQNADGRLAVFYTGADDKLYTDAQTQPNSTWGGEATLRGWAKHVAVGQNADGRLEVFYAGLDDQIYHNAQTQPSGIWGGEAVFGGWARHVAVGRNADGRLEVFYAGLDDRLYHHAQTRPNGAWGGETALGGQAKQVVVGRNLNGRLDVFYIGTDDQLYHHAQTQPNGAWGGEAALGGWGRQLAVGHNADGRLEVFYLGLDSQIYHNAQTQPNGAWGGEAALGGWGQQIAVGHNADGRLEVFYIGLNARLYHNAQTRPNGAWGGEAALGGLGKYVAVGRNLDGRLEVFYIGLNDQLYHNAQTQPNGAWGGEVRL